MIKRYTVGSIGLAPLSEGEAVLFTDHEAVVQKLRDKITITIVNFEERRAKYETEWEAKEKALREALITCVQELHNPQGYEHRRAVIDNAEAILNREQEKQL